MVNMRFKSIIIYIQTCSVFCVCFCLSSAYLWVGKRPEVYLSKNLQSCIFELCIRTEGRFFLQSRNGGETCSSCIRTALLLAQPTSGRRKLENLRLCIVTVHGIVRLCAFLACSLNNLSLIHFTRSNYILIIIIEQFLKKYTAKPFGIIALAYGEISYCRSKFLSREQYYILVVFCYCT